MVYRRKKITYEYLLFTKIPYEYWKICYNNYLVNYDTYLVNKYPLPEVIKNLEF